MKASDIYAPIVYGDTVPIVAGSTGRCDLGRFLLSDEPYYITEMRWTVQPLVGANVLGGRIRAKMSIGSHRITNEFVPIWNFGRSNGVIEHVDNGFGQGGGYVWKLHKPMLVLPSTPLDVTLSVDADYGSNPTVRFSVVGGFLPKNVAIPRIIDVPYVACFAPTRGLTEWWNTEQTLENPFKKNISVNRLIGRIELSDALIGIIGGDDFIDSDVAPPPTIKIWDSYGYDLVPKLLPFNLVFKPGTRDWVVNRDLGPRQYYRMYFKGVDPTLVPGVVPQVSMVAYRKEEV